MRTWLRNWAFLLGLALLVMAWWLFSGWVYEWGVWPFRVWMGASFVLLLGYIAALGTER